MNMCLRVLRLAPWHTNSNNIVLLCSFIRLLWVNVDDSTRCVDQVWNKIRAPISHILNLTLSSALFIFYLFYINLITINR